MVQFVKLVEHLMGSSGGLHCAIVVIIKKANFSVKVGRDNNMLHYMKIYKKC